MVSLRSICLPPVNLSPHIQRLQRLFAGQQKDLKLPVGSPLIRSTSDITATREQDGTFTLSLTKQPKRKAPAAPVVHGHSDLLYVFGPGASYTSGSHIDSTPLVHAWLTLGQFFNSGTSSIDFQVIVDGTPVSFEGETTVHVNAESAAAPLTDTAIEILAGTVVTLILTGDGTSPWDCKLFGELV